MAANHNASSIKEKNLYSSCLKDVDLVVYNDDEPEGPWKDLPTCPLLLIFRYLPGRARCSAALTCKSWNAMFNHPSLWRKRIYRLHSHKQSLSAKNRCLGFCKQFGTHLKSLTISIEHPTYSMCKLFQRLVTDMTGILIWRHCKLQEFVLPRLHADRYWRQDQIRNRLVASLARLLRKQNSLRLFSMTDSHLSVQNGLHILDSLRSGIEGSKTLVDINLQDFFQSRLTLHNVGRFLQLLLQFKDLQSLQVNYSYISNDVLELLAKTCAGTLKFLNIKVYKLDPISHEISSKVWKNLKRACPALKVGVHFECVGHIEIYTRILSREIPLKYLQVWTGVHPRHEYWNLAEFLLYIANTFPTELEDLNLALECGQELVDVAFITMLEKLENLKYLDVQTELSLDTIEALMILQRQRKINLKKCYLTLDRLLPLQVHELFELVDNSREMIKQNKFDFRIQSGYTIIL